MLQLRPPAIAIIGRSPACNGMSGLQLGPRLWHASPKAQQKELILGYSMCGYSMCGAVAVLACRVGTVSCSQAVYAEHGKGFPVNLRRLMLLPCLQQCHVIAAVPGGQSIAELS